MFPDVETRLGWLDPVGRCILYTLRSLTCFIPPSGWGIPVELSQTLKGGRFPLIFSSAFPMVSCGWLAGHSVSEMGPPDFSGGAIQRWVLLLADPNPAETCSCLGCRLVIGSHERKQLCLGNKEGHVRSSGNKSSS